MAKSGLPEVYPELQLPTTSALDETRGRFCYSATDLLDLDPDRRTTLANLSMRLGSLLGPRIFVGSASTDPSLNVDEGDVKRMSAVSFARGLYIYRDDPRYERADQLIRVTSQAVVDEVRRTSFKLPFEATYRYQPGVVFNPKDYGKIVHSPRMLTKTVGAKTRGANHGRTNIEETDRRVRSSEGQSMEGYISKGQLLLDRYQQEGSLTWSLYKQARGADKRGGTPQNHYKVRNLDAACHQFGILFHELIELAAINNGWTSHDIQAAHKVSVYERYLANSPDEINAGWRRQLTIYGLYNNARRFKVMQSLRECEIYRDMNRRFVRSVIASQTQATEAA